MNLQDKLDKVERAIASSNTPKEFIPDLKRRKAELEKQIEDDRVAELVEAEKAAHEKAAKQRGQLKNDGNIRRVRKPSKKQITVLQKKKANRVEIPGRSRDLKYFNPAEKWEVKYAKKTGRKKLRYANGGRLSSTSKQNRLVQLTLSNGEQVNISKAAYLKDADIHKQYQVGDKFDTFGKDGKQEITKVEIIYGEGGRVAYNKGGKVNPKQAEYDRAYKKMYDKLMDSHTSSKDFNRKSEAWIKENAPKYGFDKNGEYK